MLTVPLGYVPHWARAWAPSAKQGQAREDVWAQKCDSHLLREAAA